MLEQRMDIIALSLDKLFSSHANDKDGEKDLDVVDAIPTTETEVDATRAEANDVEVVDETITSHEDNEAEFVDEAVRADVEAHNEDLPFTPSADAGDKENDDEDDDNEDDDDSSTLPDAGKDLGGDDDENGNDDDFKIQYHKPTSALKGVSLRDSTS
ncbi:prostatic spermine-binding protein-like [Cynara cardunculus var. scolymus]|uniref:prostatic spermine-binding protein-like n=1 Tax=Cynara cardunculus var. scolymus TaxID=59895 RepID=UPI000D62AF55|nr:prostatic spermine-binding protein-like [Cynara cardunculus var. scolymus]